MEVIGRYEVVSGFSMKNAGTCKWCFARWNGAEYFIKEFADPKHPETDSVSNPDKIARKLKKCKEFEDNKKRAYSLINNNSDGNAVRITEFFRVGSKYYMAMPKVKAEDLDEKSVFLLPMNIKLRLCGIIAHAVSGLHRGSFIHADIKHTNVLFTYTPAKHLTAKLIDYDTGYFEDSPPTHPEEVGGDFAYISPEAWRTAKGEVQRLSCKQDVFSMGVLFHQYLAGELPEFDRHKYEFVANALVEGGKVEVSKALPNELKSLLERMLCLDPMLRPTAYEVFCELCRGESIVKNTPEFKPDPLGGTEWYIPR